jgi:outer membrane biosynthesis protein TonB
MTLPRQPGADRLIKMLGISLVIHIASVAFLNLNPWPTVIKLQPSAYTVTLMPLSLREPEVLKATSPPPKEEISKPVEKVKPIEKPKKEDIIEKVKKTQREKESNKRLQEALEEIRKKAALDEIRKRVARKEREEE